MTKHQPEYLDTVELYRLTGYKKSELQSSWLEDKGIPHRVDGHRVVVSRIHVQAWLEGRTVVRSSGLNIAAIK